MSFLRRIFSGEYRRALAAEATGDLLEASRHYALCGDRAKVAALHLRRAEAAPTRAEAVAALRDAMAWADRSPDLRRQATRALAHALLARGKAEGVATERDRDAAREAARLLEEAGDFAEAGAAWEQLGDHGEAASAYEHGGLPDLMEVALARDDCAARRSRRRRDAYEDHELHWKSGDREAALAALRTCADLATASRDEDASELRQLLATCEARRLASGTVRLRRITDGTTILLRGEGALVIGRDAPCDLVVRAANVSRAHAEVRATPGPTFLLRDTGSRHGTFLAGLPIAGEVALRGEGRFTVGPDCEIAYRELAGLLRLELARGGSDRAAVLAGPGTIIDLEPLLHVGATLGFRDGRPYLEARPGRPLGLNGNPIAHGPIQLVREDQIAADGVELEVR